MDEFKPQLEALYYNPDAYETYLDQLGIDYPNWNRMPFAAASKLTSGISYVAQTKPNSPIVSTSYHPRHTDCVAVSESNDCRSGS